MKSQDFETDLKNEMHHAFSSFGLRIPIRAKIEDMLLEYLTIHKKLVFPRPRNIYVTPDLEKKLVNHDKREVVEVIRKRLELGHDVNQFQSKRLFQTKFHDHLLYEWNIHHFHLSLKMDKKNKAFKKSDQLLFTYIDENNAILLDIEPHNEGVFADEKWLEIIDNHFPEFLEPYLDNHITDISPNLNPIERQKLWNYGYTIGMTKVNGKIVHSPGIGRMTSGHSIIVTKTCDEILRWLYNLNDAFDNNLDPICKMYNLNPEVSNFKLRLGDPTIELFEQNSDTSLLFYPYIFNFQKNMS